MSAAKGGVHRREGIRSLISSRFEYFLAFFVVSLSIIVIIIALIVPIIDRSLSQPVVQGMIAIVSGVIGFYFGNRGAERAEERVREVENQLATGVDPLAIQRGRIDGELQEIHEKMKNAIEQANRASELHVANQKREADRYFWLAEESTYADCYCAMKAWIIANHAWLKLDQDSPPYEEILRMFKESQEFHDHADIPSGLFPKINNFGKAIALIWINEKERGKEKAIQLLNSIEDDIAEMDDLYTLEDLKLRDIKKFLEPSVASELRKKVAKYLEEAKSHYEKAKKA